MRTVYVPGGTRGPCVELNAICAAGGTRGGLTRIGHVTRLMPRRTLAGIGVDDGSLVVEDVDLELAEQMAALLVVGDLGAVRADWGRVKLASPSAQPPNAVMRCCTGRVGEERGFAVERLAHRARAAA